ncbi:MAG: dihydroneopterin aldolase [Mucilaginibacter sp.]|nr:dihydroneopterin aldolase [Mucilaginibacter sp.]
MNTTISLHGAEFFAYHGFYPEEQILGNRFIVDIEVDYNFGNKDDDDISNTVDYEQLYNIANEQMKQTRKLIETVANAMANEIKAQFPLTDKVTVSIKKLNPALSGKVDYSRVVVNI